MKENSPMRLARPIKNGILHMIFSRAPLILALMILQILLLVWVFSRLEEYVPALAATQGVFTVGMIIYLFNSSMDSAAKLTWMFLIAVLPLPGSVLLLFTQTNTGHRRIKKRIDTLIGDTRDSIPQPVGVLEALTGDGSGTDDLVRYLNRSGCFPAYADSEAEYFPSGEDLLPVLLEELEKAERFIFLEFFIIQEGYMWGKVLEVLTRKVRQGVEVRVMYDGMCELFKLPSNYPALLREYGIRAKTFAPISPLVSSHYNYRDHRKILVVDGKVAITGGVNLADEYINREKPFGQWKDAALLIRGPAVRSFTLLFLQMWNIDEKEPVFTPWLDAAAAPSENANGYVIPYGDCPLDGDKVGESVYIDMLYRANEYVHIMTPYLILDGELETALKYAAQRGIDVKLILPGIPDKKLAYALAKSHYAALLRSGVKIYEYTPGFVHAKVFVSDNVKAVVGTINLDYRSLYHHFECAAYLYRSGCISAVETDFQRTLEQCRTVTEQSVAGEKLFYKIVGRLLKFIAPLM